MAEDGIGKASSTVIEGGIISSTYLTGSRDRVIGSISTRIRQINYRIGSDRVVLLFNIMRCAKAGAFGAFHLVAACAPFS
jgi:hypothetical protein